MTVSIRETPITEQFDNASGRWRNYDAYDATQRAQLRLQQHRDIRCFKTATTTALTMTDLDVRTMQGLDGTAFSGFVTTNGSYGETWSLGTLAVQSDRNNWHGLTVPCSTGANVTASAGPAIDLWSDFADSDVISVALPAFPLASLTLAQCSITLTAANAATSTVTFSSATGSTLISGDSQLRIPRSAFFTGTTAQRQAALSNIVGVSFTFNATGATSVRILAVRLLAANWTLAPVDFNTLTGRLVRPVSLNGAATPTITFPANSISDAQIPTDWPIMFRSYEPSDVDLDPAPIDLSEVVFFGTGAKLASGDLRFYFRATSQDLVTQLDLNQANGGAGTTQAQLNALGQPLDYGSGGLLPKTMADLNPFTQGELDGHDQFTLEAAPDHVNAAWIEVDLSWTTALRATLTLRDTEGNSYSHSPVLRANSRYALMVDLEDTTLRVRIYTASGDVLDPTPVFDTAIVDDDFIFRRRSGRVAWYAKLLDGNAYIDSIRAYRCNFAEYRSTTLRSLTPVVGGQLFAAGTPPTELFSAFSGTNGATVTPDASKSTSGQASLVSTPGIIPFEGAATNVFAIQNFAEATIRVDLWVPSVALAGDLVAVLADRSGRYTMLNLPRITPDRWQTYRLDLAPLDGVLVPGDYTLRLIFTTPIKATFFIDNASIEELALAWYGRSHGGDAWGDTRSLWTPFRALINSQATGVLFDEPGTAPQIRAVARRQTATLSQIKFLPKYAELGRLVWPDDPDVRITNYLDGRPSVIVTNTLVASPEIPANSGGAYVYPNGHASGAPLKVPYGIPVTFTAINEVGPSDPIDGALYPEVWDLGDGTVVTSPTVTHYFPTPTPHQRVSYTATDAWGRKTTFGRQISFGPKPTGPGPYTLAINTASSPTIAFTISNAGLTASQTYSTWSFGDGSPVYSETGNDVVGYHGNTASHTYAASGTYEVRAYWFDGAASYLMSGFVTIP